MFDNRYRKQVQLLLRCIPEISKIDCFALKGGTALNLFLHDLPRISVDIDLTYLPVKSRDESLADIGSGLQQIAANIVTVIPGCVVRNEFIQKQLTKIHVTTADAIVTIEPNLIVRGSVDTPQELALCERAQSEFSAYVKMQSLSPADLYGGKLCAALDRQHPRDLFDVKVLLDHDGLSPEVRRAFVVYLAGHPRPMSELLSPRLQDLSKVFLNQFQGMTETDVSLDELIDSRKQLLSLIPKSLDAMERQFLISMKEGEPDWDVLGISHLQNLPALKWKLLNIKKMSATKRRHALDKLKRLLE